MNISQILIKWYNSNKRNLPWRETTDPYKIWISEIILQQTRVNQGLDYYNRFIKEFPNVKVLAAASEQSVLKLWQGLGYYSRARNLHYTAKEISIKYKGNFPDAYEDIINLKGIGKYTASAILSIAFNKPYAVADGNVIRVITRLFNISEPIEKATTKKEIDEAITEIFDDNNPATFNQAVMEFGAIQCTPQKPNCQACPLQEKCLGFKNKTIDSLPNKSKKAKTRDRFFNYLIISEGDYLHINKRSANDIWKNLYDFPLIETDKKVNEKSLILGKEWNNLLNDSSHHLQKISNTIKHKLSHQLLHVTFYHITLEHSSQNLEKKYIRIKTHDLQNYPVPIIISKYMDNFNNNK